MNGKLPDTNIFIAALNEEEAIVQKFREAGSVYLSTIALGELQYGARNSGRVQENLAKVDEYTQKSVVLACDQETAAIYGVIKKQLKDKGKMIPVHDVWIAALAMQYNLTVVTRDKHFNEVEGIQLEKW
jgi:tRNA(fMet)-specific endonuclease VapC